MACAVGSRSPFAFGGVIVVVRPGFGTMHSGMLLSLGSAACGSVYVTLTRVVSRGDSAGVSLAYAGRAGFIGLSVVMPFVWQPASALVWILFFGLSICRGLSHYLLIQAFEVTPRGTPAPFVYVQIAVDDDRRLACGLATGRWSPAWIGLVLIVGSGL